MEHRIRKFLRKTARDWKARHDDGICKKCVRWIVGLSLIAFGAFLGFVPGIPGFVFVLIGLVILGFDVEKRLWKKAKKKLEHSKLK